MSTLKSARSTNQVPEPAGSVGMSAITSEIASNPPMMQTTLRKIRAAGPCGLRLEDGQRVGYLKLRHHLGEGYGDDTPVDITAIIDNNGLDYALWCLCAVDGHAREMLLYAYWCAREVPSLRSVAAPDVAERHANGAAAAGAEAAWAALAARAALAALAVTDASWAALPAREGAMAALAAARDARDAARAAQADELKRICAEIAAGRDPYPAAGVIA